MYIYTYFTFIEISLSKYLKDILGDKLSLILLNGIIINVTIKNKCALLNNEDNFIIFFVTCDINEHVINLLVIKVNV